ncbi:MAG TPA: histidine phosphatase family protein [Microlunatus sp.]|nr:histidine phosphatase family protein [Microlunatus sp.]
MTTELYLIRHGESVANVEPIIGGRQGDVGLTDRGRRQAGLLEQRLVDSPISADVLYTSTLPRARQTAEYVSRGLRLEPRTDDAIRELDPGAADGLSVTEWRERHPGFGPGPLNANPFHEFAPGGESWAQFIVRAGAALLALVDRHPDQTVVAVTHGGVIEASVMIAFGLGPTAQHIGFDLLNTGITQWRCAPSDEKRPDWTLVTLNDAGHLAGEVSGDDPRQAVPTPPEE